MARNCEYYSLLVNVNQALYGIVEDYPGLRHRRLRNRLRKIRRGIITVMSR